MIYAPRPDMAEIADSMAVLPGASGLSFDDLKERVPWLLTGAPMEVQLAAIHAAQHHATMTGQPGFAYFMEQGLGKTATALNEFLIELEAGNAEIMVVVAPPSFIKDWEVAVKEWVPFDLPVVRWPQDPRAPTQSMGPGRPLKKLPPVEAPFVFVINWEMLRQPTGQEILGALFNKYDTYLTEDETSYIKNNKSAVGASCIALAKDAKICRALNGTPLTQDFLDIYGQYRAIRLWNGLLFTKFKRTYAKLGGYMGKKIEGVDPNKVPIFREEVMKHCFRAMKKDWGLDIPKLYLTRNFDMTPDQERIYREMELDFYVEIEGVEVEAQMVIGQRMKLQQIASGFALDGKGGVVRIMPADKNPKLLSLLDTFRYSGNKFCVTRTFMETSLLLKEAFDGDGIRYVEMVRGMSEDAMTDLKDEFNRNDAVDCIILPSKIGRMGHTLLGTEKRRCFTMHLFENDYNRLTRAQIEDRIHRWGQDASACMYTDFAGSPIERDIAEALQKKADMEDFLMNLHRAKPYAATSMASLR